MSGTITLYDRYTGWVKKETAPWLGSFENYLNKVNDEIYEVQQVQN